MELIATQNFEHNGKVRRGDVISVSEQIGLQLINKGLALPKGREVQPKQFVSQAVEASPEKTVKLLKRGEKKSKGES